MSMIGFGTLPVHQQVGPVDGRYIYYADVSEADVYHVSRTRRRESGIGDFGQDPIE